jgi:hypothetical protein
MADQRRIYVGSLNEKTQTRLVSVDLSAVYSSAGYLLYANEDTLRGQAFDATPLEFSGQPFTIAEHVSPSTTGYGAVSVSVTGVLAYASVMSPVGGLKLAAPGGKSPRFGRPGRSLYRFPAFTEK